MSKQTWISYSVWAYQVGTAAALLVATLGTYIDHQVLPIEWLVSFRTHVAAAYFLGLLLHLKYPLEKLWHFLGVFLLLALLIEIVPYYFSGKSVKMDRPILKMMYANLLKDNPDVTAFGQSIAQAAPDMVVLVELTERNRQQLALETTYPYHQVITRDDPFGMGIYSKIPFKGIRTLKYGEGQIPLLIATFEWEGELFDVVLAHPKPPSAGSSFRQRNELIADLAQQDFPVPLIVAGDFNATPFSPPLRQLMSNLGLRDARKGFGWQPTWPASLSFIGIPIDYFLVSESIQVHTCKVGKPFGSDHLPIYAEFSFD